MKDDAIEFPTEEPQGRQPGTRAVPQLETRQSEHVVAAWSQLDRSTAQLAKSIRELQSTIDERIQDFTIATDASSRVLARWTKVQAIASLLLGLVAIPLVIASAIQALDIWFRWHPR